MKGAVPEVTSKYSKDKRQKCIAKKEDMKKQITVLFSIVRVFGCLMLVFVVYHGYMLFNYGIDLTDDEVD